MCRTSREHDPNAEIAANEMECNRIESIQAYVSYAFNVSFRLLYYKRKMPQHLHTMAQSACLCGTLY